MRDLDDTHIMSNPPKKQRLDISVSNSDEESDNQDLNQRDDNASEQTEKAYKIEKVSRKISRKFAVEDVSFEARVISERLKDKKLDEISDELEGMFDEMLNDAGRNYDADDRIRLSIEQDQLEQDIVIHIQPRHNVTGRTVMDRSVVFFKR